MSWANVQQWLDESDLPFKWSIYASAAEDMLFPDVYSHFFDYLYRAARSCIVFENLPDTFYEPFFAMTLFINGKIAVFRRNNGELVALNCAQASEPDIYYVPTKVLLLHEKMPRTSFRGILILQFPCTPFRGNRFFSHPDCNCRYRNHTGSCTSGEDSLRVRGLYRR